jgi:hypothetical protein
MNFKGKKKTPNMNSHHQIEPFDTNIEVNNIFLSLPPESGDLSISSLDQGLRNNKNELLYQN